MALNELQDIDDIPNELVTVLYGPQGVGKTILATRMGDKNIIITNERSYVSLSQFPELKAKTKVFRYNRFDVFTNYIRKIASEEVECDNLIVDTFPGLIGIKLREQLTKVDFNRKHADVNSLEDYQLLTNHVSRLVESMVSADISIVFITHDRIPDPESYGKGDRLTRPNLPFRVFEHLNGYANVVAYMHKRKGPDKRSQRYLLLDSSPEFVAKNHLRFDPLVTDDDFVKTIREWKGI